MSSSAVETSILLLPESHLSDADFQDTCIKTLLKVPGCISVAVHAFDGVSGPNARKRWYAVVTFQLQKVNAEQLKDVLAKQFTEAPRELNVGMFQKIEKLNAPPANGARATPSRLKPPDVSSIPSSMEKEGVDGDIGCDPTVTPPQEKVSYFAMGDSDEDDDEDDDDSNGENENAALDALDWWGLSDAMGQGSDYDDMSPSLRGLGISDNNTEQRLTDNELDDDSNDGYLAEGAGAQHAVLSLMAPLVGVFGYDRARQMNEKYASSWAVAPQ